LIAAGTAMGMLVPPAIFVIVIASITHQSAVAFFLPPLGVGLLMALQFANVTVFQHARYY